MKQALKNQIDHNIKKSIFDIGGLIKPDGEKSECIDILSYCFTRHNLHLASILLHSFKTLETLTKEDWREIIPSNDCYSHWVFCGFVCTYCYYDSDYLSELGLPLTLVEEWQEWYDQPVIVLNSDHDALEKGKEKLRLLKNKALRDANLSPTQAALLFKMFTARESF